MRAFAALLGLLLAASGCRRVTVRADPAPLDAGSKPPGRVVLLGRVVDVARHRVELVLTEDAPLLELYRGNRAFTFGSDGMLRAFRMEDGRSLWSARPPEPCLSLTEHGVELMCMGGTTLVAYDRRSGASRVVFRSADRLSQVIAAPAFLMVLENTNRLVALEPSTGATLASSLVPGKPRSDSVKLAVRRDDNAVCFVARDYPQSSVAGCYGPRLDLLWAKTIAKDERGSELYVLHHCGRDYGVLASEPEASKKCPGCGPFEPPPSRSAIIRWSDARVVRLEPDPLDAIVQADDGSALLLVGMFLPDPPFSRFEAPFGILSPPPSSPLLLLDSDKLVAIDAARGVLLWEDPEPWNARTVSIDSIAIVDGRLVLTGHDDDHTRLAEVRDLASGKTLYADQAPPAKP